MRQRSKILLSLLLVISVLVGLSLYLSDVTIGNRVFIAQPEIHQGVAQITVDDAGLVPHVTIIGRITTSAGKPLQGAMITAIAAEGAYRVTVYSDFDGKYSLTNRLQAPLEVRVRAHNHVDQTQVVDTRLPNPLRLDVELMQMTSAQEKSDELPASAHAAFLKWPDKNMRDAFISQCHFCHQIGNEFTRSPRDIEEWTEIVDRMEGYLVMLTDSQKNTIRDTLAASFVGKSVTSTPKIGSSTHLAQVIVEEWQVGDGDSFIHDADVGHDGRLYGVDEGHDVLWILDRNTGQIERIFLPPSQLPVGGKFSGLAMPIGIFTGRHGPHSLAQGEDGRIWITNALSSTLMSYQPDTKMFEIFAIGGDALYPHTIRIDKKGTIWFTLAASNQVARFVPQTRTFTIINLPSNGLAHWLSDLYFPLVLKTAALFPRSNLHLSLSHHKWFGLGKNAMAMPYGIDVNPEDGSIWYSKLYGNRIGRIDPQSLEISEVETPLSGPRRPRFDAGGTLWIPAFGSSALMAFDPKNATFQIYKLPLLSSGEYETPYALNVQRQSQNIWVTSNQSDRVFRLDPETQHFHAFPLPTKVSFLRDLVFTDDGKICSSQSNLPAYAIEGGVPSFICIDAGGN